MSRSLLRTAAAVTVTAVAGGIGTQPGSRWYRSLDKPDWQPPGAVFGPVWTGLYAAIAVAAARAIDRADEQEARAIERALWVNLGLNTGWSWLFFTAQRPDLALVEAAALEVSTLDLIRRVGRVDRTAAVLLTPYALWNGFATVLTADIVRRNR